MAHCRLHHGPLDDVRRQPTNEPLSVGGRYLRAVSGGVVCDLARSSLPRRRLAERSRDAGGVSRQALAFDLAYIAPQKAMTATRTSLFLNRAGLAVPPKALAARAPQWLDDAGAVAARKVDARVEYLGAGYDRALSTYYFRLWREFPLEMAGIYREKLALARRSAEKLLASEQQATYWFVKDGKWMTRAAWPALKIADVVGVVGVFALLFLIGVLRPRALDVDLSRGFLLAALALAVLGNFVESAVTLADVVIQYSNIYLFGLIFAGLLIYQTVIDVCWRRWGVGARTVRV
jgi:hypothetical protein